MMFALKLMAKMLCFHIVIFSFKNLTIWLLKS